MRLRTFLPLLGLPISAACSSAESDRASTEFAASQTLGVAAAPGRSARAVRGGGGSSESFDHVLLVSIDGLHDIDMEKFIAAHPSSALAKLSHHGKRYTRAFVNRLDGSATNPTDSFPGLLALTTGGSSPTHGGWYDVSYSRDLFPYSATAPCTGTPGTAVAYDESIDSDLTFLWGSKTDDTPTHLVTVARTRFNPTLLPYAKNGASCTPVFPHQFIRTNTIFNVAKNAGLHTAWSDKHLSYELVTGPTGDGLDDYFAPDINSDPANSLIPTATPGGAFTDTTAKTELYDDFKVQAILNEIGGRWSDDGLAGASDLNGRPGVPAIFGMNFQAVSVAQKSAFATGGYATAAGDPGVELAEALAHTDSSIGKMVDALAARDLLESTLIIITAKHGQSPIDHSLVQKLSGDAVAALLGTVAPVAGHIEDDVGLYWLKDPSTVRAAASILLTPPAGGIDPLADVVMTTSTDSSFVSMFGDPSKDPHTPDIIVKTKHGVIYSLSKKKNAEHGGFADDDSHVGLLVSNPSIEEDTVRTEVRTKQVAPTIIRALGLDPNALDAVRIEGTKVLPDLL
ncbi:MAG: alkaline phosphatase family protein [Myxococcota bacterium]|nr:alkaline phosphatase family protein [Myxococcota bacterium]